jgi:hypothetical protein
VKAAPAAKTAKKASAAKAAPAAKTAGKKGKGQQKCSVPGCGVLGHNKKGHDKYVASQAAGANAAPAVKAAPAAKASVKAEETKSEAAPAITTEIVKPSFMSADEVVAEMERAAQAEKPAASAKDNLDMEEAGAAFGSSPV